MIVAAICGGPQHWQRINSPSKQMKQESAATAATAAAVIVGVVIAVVACIVSNANIEFHKLRLHSLFHENQMPTITIITKSMSRMLYFLESPNTGYDMLHNSTCDKNVHKNASIKYFIFPFTCIKQIHMYRRLVQPSEMCLVVCVYVCLDFRWCNNQAHTRNCTTILYRTWYAKSRINQWKCVTYVAYVILYNY